MGKKAKNRCLICQAVFKQKSGDEGEPKCGNCGSNTVSRLRKPSQLQAEGEIGNLKQEDATTADLPPSKCTQSSKESEDSGNNETNKRALESDSVEDVKEDEGFGELDGNCTANNPLKKLKKGESASAARRAGADAIDSLAERLVLIETQGKQFEEAVADIQQSAVVALDCEGVKLSRAGALTLLQVATSNKFYLFDILKIGKAAFSESAGLKSFLEDESRSKLMFDCRVDSDALFHQFDVTLRGVFDVQLLCVAAARHQGNQVDFLPSLSRAVQKWMGKKVSSSIFCMNEDMRSMYSQDAEDGGSGVWGTRPLQIEAIRYAAADVAIQFPLKSAILEKLSLIDIAMGTSNQESILKRVDDMSEKRLRELRDLEEALDQAKDSSRCVAVEF